VVCLGVAVRRGGRAVGNGVGTERRGVVYGGRDRSGICVDVSLAHCAQDELVGCAGAGAARGGGVDDSFSSAAARGELAVHAGMVLGA